MILGAQNGAQKVAGNMIAVMIALVVMSVHILGVSI